MITDTCTNHKGLTVTYDVIDHPVCPVCELATKLLELYQTNAELEQLIGELEQ